MAIYQLAEPRKTKPNKANFTLSSRPKEREKEKIARGSYRLGGWGKTYSI